MDVQISALECPHIGFRFIHTGGHGWQMACNDCGITGTQHPIARVAVESFEKAVSKARAAERREIKKLQK